MAMPASMDKCMGPDEDRSRHSSCLGGASDTDLDLQGIREAHRYRSCCLEKRGELPTKIISLAYNTTPQNTRINIIVKRKDEKADRPIADSSFRNQQNGRLNSISWALPCLFVEFVAHALVFRPTDKHRKELFAEARANKIM